VYRTCHVHLSTVSAAQAEPCRVVSAFVPEVLRKAAKNIALDMRCLGRNSRRPRQNYADRISVLFCFNKNLFTEGDSI
jgi:hypothetical protein